MNQNFIIPPKLRPGKTIGLFAPSDFVEPSWIVRSKFLLESWGYKVKIAPHLYAKIDDFAAGSVEERIADVRLLISDPDVCALWAVAGGYAAPDLLPFFSSTLLAKLRHNPKWIIGYSDVCILLNALFAEGIMSVHGPNFSGFVDYCSKTHKDFQHVVATANSGLEYSSTERSSAKLEGEARGILLSSNLESLTVLFGSRYDPIARGEAPLILGIEEWKVEKCNIVRQIDSILMHRKSHRIKGVLIGRFSHVDEKSYPVWGKRNSIEDFIAERFARYGIPTAHLPFFGHIPEEQGDSEGQDGIDKHEFWSLPNGAWAELSVSPSKSQLKISVEPLSYHRTSSDAESYYN